MLAVSALSELVLHPTANQLASNFILVTKSFVDEHASIINWTAFEAIVDGIPYIMRKLDSENRIRGLKTVSSFEPGIALSLTVTNRKLIINKV